MSVPNGTHIAALESRHVRMLAHMRLNKLLNSFRIPLAGFLREKKRDAVKSVQLLKVVSFWPL
jgi:hypothetical protein